MRKIAGYRMLLVGSLLSSIVGCAAVAVRPVPDDFSLQWAKQSASLFFYGLDGRLISPFQSNGVGLPGYLFTTGGAVRLHPGEHWIRFNCPQPEGFTVSHWQPMVKATFVAGHAYELHCEGSQPVIRERTAEDVEAENG